MTINQICLKYLLILTPFVGLFLSSCSEEIKPSTDGKQTAIIFATLNQKDSIHYVKITRAFYGGGNSNEIALIPDSSYFKQVDATVKEYENGQLKRTFTLKDTIIPNKESGAFYAPEQKVYYFKTSQAAPLINTEGTVYKLEAILNNGELTVTGQTSLVGGMTISQPTVNSQFSFAQANVDVNGYASTNIAFNTGSSKKIEVKLYLEFEEFENANLLYTKSIEWTLSEIEAENISSFSNMSISAQGETFYDLIKQNATNDPQITRRLVKGIKVLVNGASTDLQKYLLVNKPSSSLAQNKASYTNLSVTNGHRVIGIFASRYHESIYKSKITIVGSIPLNCLNNNSMRELCQGPITGLLHFCSDNVADQAQPYYCN